MQRGPLPLHRTDLKIWATVWWFSIHSPGLSFCLNRKSSARFKTPGTWTALRVEELVLWPKEKTACKPVQDVRPWTPLAVYVGYHHHVVHPDYHMTPPEKEEKVAGRRLWAPGSLCARRGTLLSKHHAPVCLRRPHPSQSLMCPSQPCPPKGFMWSNPRRSTGEAAAMRPRSLRQVLTETWWPSLKRARHALKLEIRAGARRACIWTESKWTLKTKMWK